MRWRPVLPRSVGPTSMPCRRICSTVSRWPRTHEVVLELQPAVGRAQLRAHRVVGHGQQPRGDAEARRELVGDLGQAPSLAQELRAAHVGGHVPVAQREPRLSPVAAKHLRAGPGLVAHAPAGLVVGKTGQRVHDRVQVRRDREAVELEVVAGVDDRPRVRAGPGRLQHGRLKPVPGRGSAWRRRSRRRGRRPGCPLRSSPSVPTGTLSITRPGAP